MSEPRPTDAWKKDLTPITIGDVVALSLLKMTWQDGSGTGVYVTTIKGTAFSTQPREGPHSFEHARREAVEAYELIAEAIDSEITR